MAEKKPSKYSDRGSIGSAEELDAYGVWVKSEPQDLTTGMADTVNFDAEAVPYADFDMEFDGSEESNFDFPGLEPEIPEISIESDEIETAESIDNDNFDEEIKAPYPGTPLGRGGEEASTQLLMKIANELSAIRSELSTLKKEFAGVRVEGVSGVKTETRHGGFFDGEEGDDEKITLTGDEMQNILTSADFSPSEEDIAFDPQRDADEAALKELSEQNESAAETGEEEEIKIDFDNLGISLDDDTGAEAEINDEFPPLEAGADDDLEIPSFDDNSLPLEEASPLEELPSEELQEEIMPLEAIAEEDDEELQELRREGAVPFTPAPDNSVYLETDPFALDESSLEETSLEDISIEDTSFAESGLTETAAPEEAAPAETVSQDMAPEITEELSFDDIGLDLDTDEFSIDEDLPAFEEESGAVDLSTEGKKNSEINIESPASLEEETNDELSVESPVSLDEEISLESSISFEEEPSEEISLESSIALEEEPSEEISLESSISLEEEPSEEISLESPISLEEEPSEEISLESPISLEEEPSEEISLESSISLEEEPSEEISLESSISFEEEPSEEISLESPISLEEEPSEEISLESPISLEEEPTEELSVESPAPIEEEISGEQALDGGDLDLSEAVIDEPDLSTGIVEAPLEEPVLGDISFGDDISLDMDDFGSGIDIDIADSGSADDLTESPAAENLADVENIAIEDIDTNVELSSEDISLADDLALGDVETSVELDTGDSDLAGGSAGSLTDEPAVTDDVETSVELDTGDSSPDLALDDAETSVELDTGDSGLADSPDLTDDLASDLALDDFDAGIALDVKEDSPADDDLTGVIPEAFEINAKEAPVDDDMEAFDEGEISLPETSAAKTAEADAGDIDIPANFKSELKSVLSYMDRLLESLPESKIEEFAKSEYFDSYKKIFKELGLV
jgi:hypothetical protein